MLWRRLESRLHREGRRMRTPIALVLLTADELNHIVLQLLRSEDLCITGKRAAAL
jgi:hypothetical protein